MNPPHDVGPTQGDAGTLCETLHKMTFGLTEVPAVCSCV